MKTTSQITQEHKLFLSSINEMPMNIYLEKANKKWYSKEEINSILNELHSVLNSLNVPTHELYLTQIKNIINNFKKDYFDIQEGGRK